MPFAQLYSLLPEVAKRETRGIYSPRPDGTPGDGFAFVEMFCNEPDCDCRRVVFEVFQTGNTTVPVATLTYGWEPESFYREWAGFPMEPGDIEELKGPALMRLAPQSVLADRTLDLLRELLADEGYVGRIVEHYRLCSKK